MRDRRRDLVIVIDRGTVARGLMIGVLAALIAVPSYLLASSVQWPSSYPFQAGTPISAGEVNATFAALQTAIDSSQPVVLNVTTHTNGTRRGLTAAPSIVMESFTVDKKSPTSVLVIEGALSGRVDADGAMSQAWQYGGGPEVLGQSLMYSGDTHSKAFPTRAVIAGHTTTGPQTLQFRYFTQNGGSSRPFAVYNPGSGDDARIGQTQSVFVVWEVEATVVP